MRFDIRQHSLLSMWSSAGPRNSMLLMRSGDDGVTLQSRYVQKSLEAGIKLRKCALDTIMSEG